MSIIPMIFIGWCFFAEISIGTYLIDVEIISRTVMVLMKIKIKEMLEN